ncbi:MAG: sulfur oxidation c-type cytochrome SoxA [Pseudomonadota bacterium]
MTCLLYGGAFVGARRHLSLAVFLVALVGGETSALSRDGVTRPVTPRSADHPLPEIWSGTRYASETAQALQAARGENPANGVVADGMLLWRRVAGETEKSCASCHGDASFSMRSVGTRYPRFFRPWKKPITLEGRINRCRTAHMRAEAWPRGSKSLLAMTAYVRQQSRRQPVRPQNIGRAMSSFQRGRQAFNQRIGLLNMACSSCHGAYAGKRLGAQTLSQGQSNGFPAWRLGLNGISSLHQQFQRCNIRVGAEPRDLGADEYVDLELYLAWRGQGLRVEAPAVRD